MPRTIRPTTAKETAEVVAWAAGERMAMEIVGGASKRGLGRPVEAPCLLDLSALSGVVGYEPEELILTAAAGTPIAEIERLVVQRQQHLAFEPPDLGPFFGGAAGRGTLGGILACNLSGPRRIQAGAARDHFLGVSAINGRGEIFKAGGKVVKNVTGYDLCKLLAGSHGTLAVILEATMKVLPAPIETRTIVLRGLDDEAAIRAMISALGSSHEVTGAAHLPPAAAARSREGAVLGSGAATGLRLEGPEPSVVARADSLRRLLRPQARMIDVLDRVASEALWREIGDARILPGGPDDIVWRLSVPPKAGAAVVGAIARSVAAQWYYDWGGGLIWLTLPASDDGGAGIVRAAAAAGGGHAILLRAPDELRRRVPVFGEENPVLAALSRRLKASFDPRGILNPGRMWHGH
jgi:glycolate oxidase FAD binding subunit